MVRAILSVLVVGAFAVAPVLVGGGCSSSGSPSGTSGTSGSSGDGGSSGGDSGSSGGTTDAGAGVDAADAAPAGPVNGCKTFDDRTGAGASRTIAWMFPLAAADRCIAIKAGQSVTWSGDFTMYRVGASGGDSPNPIAGFDPTAPTVAFPKAGTFGFESPDAPALVGAIKVE
jgi:hypothetical protein